MGMLLLGADYYGTLAAVRCLGRKGIPVLVADETRDGRALFSRFVKEKHVHPPLSNVEALVEWLMNFGKQHPGTVLYPPNDHLAWLFAVHGDRLREVFQLDYPGEDAVLALLDKYRLAKACSAVGIEFPDTWYSEREEDMESALKDARYPLLIKPRTQIYLESGIKGVLVQSAADVPAELARYKSLVRFNRALTDRHPDITRPMFQEYLTAAETSIFSVSGYVSREHGVVARSAMKVLQRPRKVGIGLCFEAREPETRLLEQLHALCNHVGYWGSFEAEFIADGDKRLLIDVNPRFFSQMGFDVARHSPIPLFVYHASRAENSELVREMDAARTWQPAGQHAYCHKTMLDLVLTLQGTSGQMSKAEVRSWRRWVKDHEGRLTDAVRDDDDRMPAIVDAASWVRHFARHPRSFVRSFVFNR